MKKLALITASLALLASPVFAEEAKTIGTAPAEAKFSTVSKDEMFSSKLKGLNVYNQKDRVGRRNHRHRHQGQPDRRADPVGRRLPRHGRALRRGVAVFGQHPPRRQERQMAGDDEHHQGSAEGRAGVQVSEVSAMRLPRRAAVGGNAGALLVLSSSLRGQATCTIVSRSAMDCCAAPMTRMS